MFDRRLLNEPIHESLCKPGRCFTESWWANFKQNGSVHNNWNLFTLLQVFSIASCFLLEKEKGLQSSWIDIFLILKVCNPLELSLLTSFNWKDKTNIFVQLKRWILDLNKLEVECVAKYKRYNEITCIL